MHIELTTHTHGNIKEYTYMQMHIQYLHKCVVFTHMHVCMATVASCLMFLNLKLVLIGNDKCSGANKFD